MISDLVRTLLHKRGVTEVEAIEQFLKPDFVRDTHDPFLLHDMERAVRRPYRCGMLCAYEYRNPV